MMFKISHFLIERDNHFEIYVFKILEMIVLLTVYVVYQIFIFQAIPLVNTELEMAHLFGLRDSARAKVGVFYDAAFV